jgi:hypothetical protein
MAGRYGVDELVVVTITHDFADRAPLLRTPRGSIRAVDCHLGGYAGCRSKRRASGGTAHPDNPQILSILSILIFFLADVMVILRLPVLGGACPVRRPTAFVPSMKKHLFLLALSCHMTLAQNPLQTKFERTNGRETVTYAEGMAYYRQLDETFETIRLIECGPTDTGLPLHVAVLSPDGTFDPETIRREGKAVLLVNNAIHPGEPDGVDASVMLLRDLARDKKLKEKMARLVLVVVPFYNIGGVLNRNSTTRVSQTGPPNTASAATTATTTSTATSSKTTPATPGRLPKSTTPGSPTCSWTPT